ncbi:hypothetical protein ACFWFF_03780 [Streptomyces sp. NPDC060223]|uniref:hypothetical protein n=1 Tax=unclassified Streptomyces TaxID=2593676 RepID=UPI0036343C40
MLSKRIRPDSPDHTAQDDNTPDHTAQDDNTPEDTAPTTASPFDVLIGHDGSTAVDGEPLHVPEGEPVHVVVLDMMHRHAQARGEPVEAVIFDRQGGEVTLVEVAPDGSSRVLLHEKHDETRGAERRSEAVLPPTADLSQAVAPPPVTVRPPAAAPEAVPGELAELVALVRHSVDAGALEQAAALAFRLREHTARAFGREHPYTLEAHALEAFVAHRSDNHRLAAATCIELARIRHRQGDPRVHEELTRAAAAWLLVEDVPSAVEHGRALLAVLLAVSSTRKEQGGRNVVDAALPRLVNRRMRALTDASDARVTGAA